jgi:F-type H+-transporting ATPase subunit delta
MDLSAERNETDRIFQDMRLIYTTIQKSRDLALFLRNPIVHADKKQNVLNALFSARVSSLTLAFLNIIASRRREAYLESIARSCVELYHQMKGIVTAHLYVPVKLDDPLRRQMLQYLSQETGKYVELSEIHDPSLIGGFILRWGDKQVDASVSRKLRLLRMSFKENLYLKDY